MNEQPFHDAELGALLRDHYRRQLGEPPAAPAIWARLASRLGTPFDTNEGASDMGYHSRRPTSRTEQHPYGGGSSRASRDRWSDQPSGDRYGAPDGERPAGWRGGYDDPRERRGPGQRGGRVLGWLAPVAVLLVLAIAAAALFASRGRQPEPRVGAQATATLANGAPLCDGDKTKLNLSATQSLESVSMVSPTEGWAVGVDGSTGGSLIVHGVNCVWTPITDTFPGVGLLSVSMGSPDDGWALGTNADWYTGGQGAGTGGALLHYTGGKWQQASLDLGVVSSRSKIQMLSADVGWMYVNGGISPGPTSKLYKNSVWHYQNGTWTKTPLPFITAQTQIWGLSALPSGDCWVVGYNVRGVIGHYHNGTWSSITTTQQYYDVSMISATDGWAVGNPVTLMHFDGTGWHDEAGKITGSNGASELDSVMATSPTEAWAFYEPFESGSSGGTYTGQQETVAHLKDGKWSWESLPLGPIDFVKQVSMASTSEGWGIGIMHDDNNSFSFYRGVLVRFHAGAWTSYEPNVPNPGDGPSGPVG